MWWGQWRQSWLVASSVHTADKTRQSCRCCELGIRQVCCVFESAINICYICRVWLSVWWIFSLTVSFRHASYHVCCVQCTCVMLHAYNIIDMSYLNETLKAEQPAVCVVIITKHRESATYAATCFFGGDRIFRICWLKIRQVTPMYFKIGAVCSVTVIFGATVKIFSIPECVCLYMMQLKIGKSLLLNVIFLYSWTRILFSASLSV